jgi:hypothetical protein
MKRPAVILEVCGQMSYTKNWDANRSPTDPPVQYLFFAGILEPTQYGIFIPISCDLNFVRFSLSLLFVTLRSPCSGGFSLFPEMSNVGSSPAGGGGFPRGNDDCMRGHFKPFPQSAAMWKIMKK